MYEMGFWAVTAEYESTGWEGIFFILSSSLREFLLVKSFRTQIKNLLTYNI